VSVELPALSGAELTLGYRDTTVVHGASVELRAGHVTALVGPNGSGKSTLLRALARLHKAEAGRIVLDDGTSALDLDARAFSRRVTMLGQSRPHPSGLTVRDVVTFGRHPYRRRFGGLADTDRAAIDRALDVTGTAPMQGRAVDELRFVDKPLGSLRELLEFAREWHYNMSHVPLVRSANIAFFWLVTVTILPAVWFLCWTFVVRLHRALTAAVIVLVLSPFVRTLPVIGWLVPDWLVLTAWSATTWRVAGVAVGLFMVGTAIALVRGRRR
jgi:hypothetical protein